MKGRKRHIVVDTLGLLLAVAVHPANIQDRDGAKLVQWAKEAGGWNLELVRRPRQQHTFQVLPRRWVVERTFGWLNLQRRLSKDYEGLPETTEAWIYAAMTGIMLRRLARAPTY